MFSEIQARSVGKLPVKRNVKLESDIIKLVDAVIFMKKEDKNADITQLEREIDTFIYEIYNLSEDEIRMVEGDEENGRH